MNGKHPNRIFFAALLGVIAIVIALVVVVLAVRGQVTEQASRLTQSDADRLVQIEQQRTESREAVCAALNDNRVIIRNVLIAAQTEVEQADVPIEDKKLALDFYKEQIDAIPLLNCARFVQTGRLPKS